MRELRVGMRIERDFSLHSSNEVFGSKAQSISRNEFAVIVQPVKVSVYPELSDTWNSFVYKYAR